MPTIRSWSTPVTAVASVTDTTDTSPHSSARPARRSEKGYRVEAWVFLGVTGFFGLVDIVYFFWSHEKAGSVMLILTVFLGFLPGTYLFWWGNQMKPRPEDLPHASQEDGAGTIGAFPTSSIWPFVMGLGLAFTALGFVFGIWWGILGFGIVVSALLGYTMETRRGGDV